MNPLPATVKDVMVPDVTSVIPGALLYDAAKILAESGKDSLPVALTDGKLVGILDGNNLFSERTALHVPTLQFIARNLSLKRSEGDYVSISSDEVVHLDTMMVKDVMKPPVWFYLHTPIEDAVYMFRNDPTIRVMPVVDENKKLLGVLRPGHVLKLLDYAGAKVLRRAGEV